MSENMRQPLNEGDKVYLPPAPRANQQGIIKKVIHRGDTHRNDLLQVEYPDGALVNYWRRDLIKGIPPAF